MKELSAGDRFQDKWVLQRVLGQGGFGVVWEGVDPAIGRRVAIKLLKRDARDTYSSGMRKRFLAEAAAVARLSDPHTVTLLDYGEADTGLYFVFEFVDGTTVKHLIAELGRIPAELAVHITMQLLESLREAHAHGILHRDVKPENVMVYSYLGQDHRVKLADFGLAKNASGAAEPNITRDGAVIGTPRYMAPEALLGDPLTAAADLFSVGLVLYEMLVGRPANDAANVTSVIARQIDEAEFDLPEFEDPRLNALIERLLRKRAGERFQTADEVLAALQSLASTSAADTVRDMPAAPARLPSSVNRIIELEETLREDEQLELAAVPRTSPNPMVFAPPTTTMRKEPRESVAGFAGVLVIVLCASTAGVVHYLELDLPWETRDQVDPAELAPQTFDPASDDTVYIWLDHLGDPQLAHALADVPAVGRCAVVVDNLSNPAPPGAYYHVDLLELPRTPFVADPVAPLQLEQRARQCHVAAMIADDVVRSADVVIGEARLTRAERSRAKEEKRPKSTERKPAIEGINPSKLEGYLKRANMNLLK